MIFTTKQIITRCSEGSPATTSDLQFSHIHVRREAFYVVEGESRYMFNNQIFDAVPGSVFFIEPWMTHSNGYQPDDQGLFHLWLHFVPDTDISVFPIKVMEHGEYSLRFPSFSLPKEYAMVIDKRWNQVQNMENADQTVYERMLRGPMNAILDEIALQFSQNESLRDDAVPKLDTVIENIKKYIRTNNARGCSLEKLEKLSGYNRFYLAHRFRLYSGCTIGDFINKIRVEYTEAAFQQGMRQKEIAAELGFSSPSNFWNWLQKHKRQ